MFNTKIAVLGISTFFVVAKILDVFKQTSP